MKQFIVSNMNTVLPAKMPIDTQHAEPGPYGHQPFIENHVFRRAIGKMTSSAGRSAEVTLRMVMISRR